MVCSEKCLSVLITRLTRYIVTIGIILGIALILAQPAQARAPQAPTKPAETRFDAKREIALAEAKMGLKPNILLRTLECESNLNPKAVGDGGTSFGIAQIHLPAHPSISKEEALDPYFSITWAAEQFAAGNARMWTCWRIQNGGTTRGE